MPSIDSLQPFLSTTLDATDFPALGERYQGKVRDVYDQPAERRRILIATDRQSAFDVSWCTVPLKGQVLNQVSAWWFQRLSDLMPNHLLDVPDPNVAVVKTLTMAPVEIVVRAYLTGSTQTSAWSLYQHGERMLGGTELPDGLSKNDPLPRPILTPSTKGEHDEPISPAEVVARHLATADQWKEIADRALALFTRGQEIAAERGLILVDTKYEMGWDESGRLTLADEVHTPDSSRYWLAESYEGDRTAPEHLDKEFFRLWLRDQGFSDGGAKPAVTDDIRLMLSRRYIDLYERLIGEQFVPPADVAILPRIEQNLLPFRLSP